MSIPPKNTFVHSRSKVRCALPWLSLAGGEGVLSFEGGCVLKEISWGWHFESNNAAPKMEGPRPFPGGVAGIAFFPKHRFPFNKPLPCDPLLRGSRSQVPQGRGRLPNRRWRAAFANYAITRSVSYGQYNTTTVT